MPEIDFSELPDKAEVPQGIVETPAETPPVAPESTLEVGAIDFSGLPDRGVADVGEFKGKIPTVSGAPIAIGIDKSQRIDTGKIPSLPITNIGIDKKKMRDAFTDAATLSTLTGQKVSPSVAYQYRDSLDKKANELQDTWGQVFTKAGLAVGPSIEAGAAGLVREAEEFIQPPLPHEEFPEISLEGYKGPIPTRTTFGEEAGKFWAKKLRDVEIKAGDNTLKRYAGMITTNVLQNLPLLGIGAITGGSTVPLVAMGLVTKGRKYQEMRDRGMDDSTARLMSTVVGVSEAATEKLGFDALIKSGIPFAKRLLLASGLDVPGELINTSVEAVVDKVTINPGMNYEEYVSALIDTAIVSLGSAGALTSVSHPLVLMREQQEQRDKAFAEKQKEDIVIKGEDQDAEFKESFGVPELPEELNAAYEAARAAAIEDGKSEDEATELAIEAVSQTEEGKAYIDTVRQTIQPEAPITEAEAFERFQAGEITEEELFDIAVEGRGALAEEIEEGDTVAEIKQRLLDAGLSEEEATANAVIGRGIDVLARQAGLSVEAIRERYLPEVTREGVRVEEGDVLEQSRKIAPQIQGMIPSISDPESKQTFETGEPVEFNFIRNITPAPRPGVEDQFQQNIEPSGRFMSAKSEVVGELPGFETGTIRFEVPLVLEFNEEGSHAYDENSWKARLSEAYGGLTGQELSQAIVDSGFDSIVTFDMRAGGRSSSSEIVDLSMFEPQMLAQEAPQEPTTPGLAPRGRIKFRPDGITIELLQGMDASTFVHEMGHLYFRMLADLSTVDTASESLKTDFGTIREWLGVPEGSDVVSTEQQEQFARGFEAYLREGKAPSPELATAFENFKQWLMEVYKSLKELNVELTDDVRGVFDRLLAEEGVEVAEPTRARPPTLERAEFEQPGLADQREKDLQATQKDDIYNIEETKRRIDNELYIHDRLPDEIGSKERTGRLKDAQAVARRSLGTVSEKDAGPISVNRDIIGRRSEFAGVRKAETTALNEWAKDNGLILESVEKAAKTKKKLEGGQENYVFYSPSKDVWVKANRLEYTPTFHDLFDRVMLHNNQFPDTTYTFQGFATIRGEFMPIFTQQNRVDDAGITDAVKEQMAAEYMEQLGYTKNPQNERQWLKGDIIVQDVHAKNIVVQDGKVFIFDPVIFLNPVAKSDRVIGESIAVAREDVGEEVDFEGLGMEGLEVFEQPAPREVKPRVRKVTGQVKDKELRELRGEFINAARIAKAAFKSGKEAVAVKEARKLKNILARTRKVRLVQDYFAMSDADMKKVAARNPLLMSQWEFKQYLDNVRYKSALLSENKLQKASLIQMIYEKDLGHTDNYRRVLNLPPISQMTTTQVQEFADALDHYHDGDVFLSERELETVDRTDLAGIATWREAKERLSAEIGVSIEELETIKVKEWDDYKWDTSLAESNPFYKMLVTETTRKLLEADLRVHEIENQTFELARKSEASQDRTLAEKAVPSDPQIMDYIEALPEEKDLLAEDMTKEQLDYAHYIQSYFQIAREYLIKTKAMERGRENYFVHVRKTFLENVKDKGLLAAFRGLYQSYVEDEATFNIMDDDTGDILPLEKFFQFAMQRTGGMEPTTNVTRAFLTYVTTMEKKISLDELIPKMDIYAQSITPEIYTPRGLEIDRSLKKFVNKFINNKKGRRIRWIAKQGGVIDVTTRGLRTFTTMIDLGLSIPTGVAAFVGEQAANFEMLGTAAYVKGNKRISTKKGKAILKKYEAFIGRSAWEEFTAPGKQITERVSTGLFGLFHEASVLANKQFLLGSITPEEYNNGELSTERLAEMKIEMGRFRVVPGTKSLVGSTSAGSAMMQYKTWAAPIIRTLSKDLTTLAADIKNKPAGEALTTKEAREIYRFLGATFTVVMMGAIASSNDDDDSFTGQLLAKVYRESMTLLQSTDPTLWARAPRLSGFLFDLSRNLKSIATLEEYKTKPGLKGVSGLQRQLTPRAIKQFESKKEKRR